VIVRVYRTHDSIRLLLEVRVQLLGHNLDDFGMRGAEIRVRSFSPDVALTIAGVIFRVFVEWIFVWVDVTIPAMAKGHAPIIDDCAIPPIPKRRPAPTDAAAGGPG